MEYRLKTCFKCKESKPLGQFYKHPRMADGHLNKCKECTKRDVRQNYWKDHAKTLERDLVRNRTPERRAAKQRYLRKSREANREKWAARRAVASAIKGGRLVRMPCEVCGECRSEAHHVDYSRPLDVRWLCFRHHREAHGQVVLNDRWR